jgi:secreted trypsin-like serine protease
MKRSLTLAVALLAFTATSAAAAGPSEPRIVNGERIDIAEAPWQVALAFSPEDRGTPSERQFCGGALLSATVVVTAGHCVYDADFGEFMPAERLSVIAGRSALDDSGGAEVGVAEFRVPTDAQGTPFYGEIGGHSRWDVALLRLESAVPGTPIRIAGGDEAALWAANQSLRATGYGSVNRWGSRRARGLNGTSLTAFSDDLCTGTYPGPDGFEPEDMMCASGLGRDTCKGDSGGPLVATGAGFEARLVGVTSWGGSEWSTPCAGTAGVYTRIAADPIRSQVAGLALELGAGDVVGSGAQPAQTPSTLTEDAALQLTYNASRDVCRVVRRCVRPRLPSCSSAEAGFVCDASIRRQAKAHRATCGWRVDWSVSATGEVSSSSTKRSCRRSRR